MITAYHHVEDGKPWLRIMPGDGYDYDEDLSGWSLILDMTSGTTYYQNQDGRRYNAA